MWTNLSHHASHCNGGLAAFAHRTEMRIIIILLIHWNIARNPNGTRIENKCNCSSLFFMIMVILACTRDSGTRKGGPFVRWWFVYNAQISQSSTWPLTQFTFEKSLLWPIELIAILQFFYLLSKAFTRNNFLHLHITGNVLSLKN